MLTQVENFDVFSAELLLPIEEWMQDRLEKVHCA